MLYSIRYTVNSSVYNKQGAQEGGCRAYPMHLYILLLKTYPYMHTLHLLNHCIFITNSMPLFQEFDIDPECDTDQVDELLALCVRQATQQDGGATAASVTEPPPAAAST